MKKGYFEEVKRDVKNYMNENMDLEFDILNGNYSNIDDIFEDLNDKLFCDDSVTGNASGSYYFNNYKSKEAVFDDIETVKEALQEFCVDAETIAEKFLDEDFEYFDVTARCYVLGQAIYSVLEDNKEKLERLFEEANIEE